MKTIPTIIRSALVAFVFLASPRFAVAQIGFRQLTSTHPVAVQRGTTTTVKVKSNLTLDETHRVLFSRDGVRMSFLETAPIEAPLGGRTSPGTPFRFQADVAADAMPGVREFRVATRQAVSSVGQLLVTDYPVVEETSAENGQPTAAQSITLPAAVCGTCAPVEDVDFYRFTGRAGQEISVQIFAQRVTDKLHCMVVKGPRIYLMDPLLVLYGPAGQIVAQNDNFFGGDSFFACQLPQDGSYLLEVRDARFVGDPRYPYCVEIGEQPVVQATFPMAVQQGQTSEAELIGEGSVVTARATISGDPSQAGWRQERFATPRGLTTPVPIKSSPHPQIIEQEGNNSIAEAPRVTLPIGINGRLAQDGDVDFFSFEARKGQSFHFEVESHRQWLPLDSVLELYDAKGKLLAEADDAPTLFTKDSRLFWTAPEDGTFTLAVHDLHNRGGPRFVYHLQAEPAEPDFELFGEYYYAMLAPGTRMIWFARVERRNGCEGPIAIEVHGLPRGVVATPVSIPAGMDHCAIILTADNEAPIDATLASVRGRATVTGADGSPREIVREGIVTCEQQASGGSQSRWPIETQIVGVTGPLDLARVTASPERIRLERGGKAEVSVHLERTEKYKDAVTLDMQFKYFESILGDQLPPGVKMSAKSKARLSGDVLDGKIILEATDKATLVENLPLGVLARVSISFSITTNYSSNPIFLTVAPPDVPPEPQATPR